MSGSVQAFWVPYAFGYWQKGMGKKLRKFGNINQVKMRSSVSTSFNYQVYLFPFNLLR